MAVGSGVDMASANVDLSFIGRIAVLLGTEENALRIIYSLLLGYPLALCHRLFFYGHSPNLQHIFFTVCGLWLCQFNFGLHTVHSVANILIIYFILRFSAGTQLSVILAFVANMLYLCIGYYITMTDTYTIKWTTPHCVLTLRLIGLVCDVYDGKIKPEKLSAEQKETVLVRVPTLLEICGHTYFFGGFLVGPQFPMKRYLDFVNGNFTAKVNGARLDSVKPALLRLLAGFVYTAVFQIGYLFFPDSMFTSESFNNRSVVVKCLYIAIWGKLTLYKYVACWLMAEGVSIMTGLTYNGTDSEGNALWDSCANIRIRNYERASSCHDLVLSFNINTNRWMAKYVFKRLRFLGSKELSQLITLFFLALWHGLYSGYFMNFGLEFFLILFEKQLGALLSPLWLYQELRSHSISRLLIWFVKKLYMQFVLGYALVGFCLFTFERYSAVYSSVYWVGHIVFIVLWPLWHLAMNILRPKSGSKSHSAAGDSKERTD